MAECGAKTRAGGACKNPAMRNGRCRMHGGKSKGPKPQNLRGNTNAVTHGFYSDALQPEELVLWQRVEVGSLDEELKLARVKLHRLVRLSGSSDVAELVDAALEVATRMDTHPKFGEMEKREIKVKAQQYGDLIARQLDLIRKLELARLQMLEAAQVAKERARDEVSHPDEPVTEFRVTVVTPENYDPDRHGTRT